METANAYTATALLFCSCWPAMALAVAPVPAQVTELQQLQVQAKRYDARRDEAATRIVVDKQELTQHGDHTLADAIKRLPGVTVSAGATGSGGNIMLRGMGQGYTQILIDGQPAPSGFDVGSLSVDTVERVEIIRVATADMRAEAIAGSINIVLAKNHHQDQRTVKLGIAQAAQRLTPSINWSRSYRRAGFSASTNASLSRRSFVVQERGVETGRDVAGSADLLRNTELQAHGDRSALSLTPNLRWELGGDDQIDWNLQLDHSRLRNRVDIDWDTVYGDPLKHARYRQHIDNRVSVLRSDLTWTHHYGNGASLDAKLTLSGNRERMRFHEVGFDSAELQNLDDTTHGRIDAVGVLTQGKYSLPAGERHALQAGWDIGHEHRSESRRQRLLGFVGAEDGGSDMVFSADIDRMAVFVQDEWNLPQRWVVYWGARWEQLHTHSEGNDFAAVDLRSSVFSPSLQARWKLFADREDQLRLAFSRSFRAPTLRQLIPRPYTSTNNRELDPDQMGNPNLRPELATGVDLALEKFWGEGRMLSVGGYLRSIQDAILNQTRLIDGRWVEQPVNVGDARASGLELDGKWTLPHAIDLRFNLTRNWSQLQAVAGPDNRIDGQPRLSSTLALDQRLSVAWQWGVSYVYRSGDGSRSSAQQLSWQSPRRELDVYARHSWKTGSQLRFSASNLLQRTTRSGRVYALEQESERIERRRKMPVTLRVDWELSY